MPKETLEAEHSDYVRTATKTVGDPEMTEQIKSGRKADQNHLVVCELCGTTNSTRHIVRTKMYGRKEDSEILTCKSCKNTIDW